MINRKNILLYFSGLILALNIFSFALLPELALAQVKAPPLTTKERCDQFKNQFGITSTNDKNVTTSIIGDTPVFCSITQVVLPTINFLLIMSGTVTILFLMIGGFFYLTSAGNEEQAEKGKKILINSIIGLVVIVMSYAIVRIVSSTLSLGK